MLRLRTFGGLSAEPDTRSGRSAQRKRLALLAVLAVQRHRPVSRERLLGLFWPDRAAAEGRHALAQLVYAVRRDYAGDLLISGADDLRTNPDEFRADVIDFLDAVAGDDLEAATRCCTGVFLDGFYLNGVPDFERWVDQTRADLARRHATVLDTLAHTAAATGHADQALRWWRRRSEVATLDGAAIVELMRAAVQAGDAAAALRYAAEHQSRLHSELDAPPDPRIAALETEIRAAFVARPTPILPPPAAFDAEPRAQPVDDTSRGHGGSPPGRPRVRRRRWSIAIGALSLPLLAVAGWTASRAMSRPPGPPRLVVLGAIDGPDSALDLAVKEALRSGLEADPGIRVLGEARVNETLRLMARPTDTRIDGPVAREIALRRGAAIAVVGSAVPVGTGLEIVVRVINPATGQGRRTLADHAATADGALPALMRVRESIRHEALGVAATARLDPLPPVMTSSLVALQDYAQARIALTRSDPDRAFRLAAAALDEDSLFPMANYMVGDLDWFRDHQRSAELHLTRGLALRDRLPLRERLLVEARYQELVADRSDSALAIWSQLRDAFPGDGQAYEGMAWTYRALGEYQAAAEAADTALRLDPSTFGSSARNEIHALLESGDTLGAAAVARRFRSQLHGIETEVAYDAALRARDWPAALRASGDTSLIEHLPMRHVALLVAGRLDDAARLLPQISDAWLRHQYLPRAISLQARAEVARGAASGVAASAPREILAWMGEADLSAPAVARLAERTAELAARIGDSASIAATRRLLLARDGGRQLPSIMLALRTVDAAAALLHGDYPRAAELARAARDGMFHGRTLALAALIEADARTALGDVTGARALYQQLATPDAFAASDVETWAVLVPEVLRKLARVTPRRGRASGAG